MGYILLVLALVLNSGANFLLKIGADKLDLQDLNIRDFLSNYYILFGIVLFALNVIFYTFALSKLKLSIAYPIMLVGSLILITLASFFFLKENINLSHLTGIGFLIIGIFLIIK